MIFGAGEPAEQIIAVARAVRAAEQSVLVTRLAAEAAPVVLAALPELTHDPRARVGSGSV